MNLDTLWRANWDALKQKEKDFLYNNGQVKPTVDNSIWLVCKESSTCKVVALVENVFDGDILRIIRINQLIGNTVEDNRRLFQTIIQTIRRHL
jgi:hypothetical protein